MPHEVCTVEISNKSESGRCHALTETRTHYGEGFLCVKNPFCVPGDCKMRIIRQERRRLCALLLNIPDRGVGGYYECHNMEVSD